MKDAHEPTETNIIKTNEDSHLRKEVTNRPCACFERVYIVKIALHEVMNRFNEISVNIQDSLCVCGNR